MQNCHLIGLLESELEMFFLSLQDLDEVVSHARQIRKDDRDVVDETIVDEDGPSSIIRECKNFIQEYVSSYTKSYPDL